MTHVMAVQMCAICHHFQPTPLEAPLTQTPMLWSPLTVFYVEKVHCWSTEIKGSTSVPNQTLVSVISCGGAEQR